MNSRYMTNPDSPFRMHPVTMGLIVTNLLIFIFLNLILLERGVDFISFGTNSWMAVKGEGEYYRLFTSIFLHADIDHIMNNMLILFAIGGVYEMAEGKIRFLAVYFTGGVLASLASMAYNMKLGANVSSLGASGAIFALVGASVASVLKNRNKLRKFSRNQLIVFTLFSVYAGFRNSHTDNMAHVAGLFAGFVIGFILSKSDTYR